MSLPMSLSSSAFDPPASAQIMLLGTFHFQDAGLDWYKPQHDIGVLSDQRQRELADVIACLRAFHPTKIAIERRPDQQASIDHEYRAYQQQSFPLPANEAYQLGFRLAGALGHQQLYCIDAWGRYYRPALDLEDHAHNRTTEELNHFLAEQYDFDPTRDLTREAEQHGQEALIAAWTEQLTRTLKHAERERLACTIRETLVRGNSEQALQESHGLYLTGWFKIGSGHAYPGVDWVTAWYNRNLRIFANLQRITSSSDDRILVIFGAGHIPILRHCVLASPEYTLVEVGEYLASTADH
jgi:hypothetical protein